MPEIVHSAIDKARLKVLQEKDELCRKCALGNEMLCNGYREYVNAEDSEFYGRLCVSVKPCHKRVELDRDERITQQVLNAGFVDVPQIEEAVYQNKAAVRMRFFEDMRKVKIVGVSQTILVPRFASMELNPTNRLKAQCILYSAAESDYSVKYVDFNMLGTLDTARQMDFLSENLDTDVVYVHGALARVGYEAYRNLACAWVMQRIQNNKTTFVSLPKEDTGKYTDVELDYLQGIRQWTDLNLLSYI